jgi:hypothetical protein
MNCVHLLWNVAFAFRDSPEALAFGNWRLTVGY